MIAARPYVGLYWTLPVPWAGFTALPAGPDAAAARSRTIRYQREAVRRWVAAEKGRLVHEEAFVEVAPDRGTDAIRPTAAKLARLCRRERAGLVLVDFAEAYGWRPHGALTGALAEAGVPVMPLPPEPLEIDGARFDPVAHFREWRALEEARLRDKPARARAIRARIAALAAEGLTPREIAARLNQESIATVTGRAWTAENVRKARGA